MPADFHTRESYTRYRVWDLPVRLFHWIAVTSFIVMVASGLVMMFSGELGISREHKVLLKYFHSGVGFVFLFNLILRLVWAFAGNRYARWSAILPVGRSYALQWRAWRQARLRGRPVYFLGHNPLGRWSVMAMLMLMLGQGGTGLVLAGTDLFLPPLGGHVKQWIAQSETALLSIRPGDRVTGIDPDSWNEMRDFRTPYRSLHSLFFYLLVLSVLLHVTAVIMAERREGSALTSAMITGDKLLPQKPVDGDD